MLYRPSERNTGGVLKKLFSFGEPQKWLSRGVVWHGKSRRHELISFNLCNLWFVAILSLMLYSLEVEI